MLPTPSGWAPRGFATNVIRLWTVLSRVMTMKIIVLSVISNTKESSLSVISASSGIVRPALNLLHSSLQTFQKRLTFVRLARNRSENGVIDLKRVELNN